MLRFLKMKWLEPMRFMLFLTVATVWGACGQISTRSTSGEEDRLYSESTQLIKRYTDSLANTYDSTTIHNLMVHFQDRLDKINNGVPPETDLRLSEGQNDTLAMLIEKLLRTRDESLRGPKEPADSLATDSLKNDSIK